jgi:hypothetical protein
MLLCVVVLLLNQVIALQDAYTSFKLEESKDLERQDFIDMIDLQALIASQVYMVAINLLCIFFRAIVTVTELDEELGILTNTLANAMVGIIFFSINFMALLCGFVLFAFFTFGFRPHYSGYTTLGRSFYVTFAMLLGQSNYEGISRADPVFGVIFYFCFYLGVLFVQLNMFISILLSGFDQCDHEIQKKKEASGGKAEDNLMKKIYKDLTRVLCGSLLAQFIMVIMFVWRNALKPVLSGLFSCFVGILKSCVCACPACNPKAICARLCGKGDRGGDGQENSAKELKDEIKRGKDLEKKAKSMQQGVERKDPNKADLMQKQASKVHSMLQNFKEEMKTRKDHEVDIDAMTDLPGKVEDMRSENNILHVMISVFEEKSSIREKLLMLTFMVIFVCMLSLMSRGQDSFFARQATLDPVLSVGWVNPNPLRSTSFEQIESLEEAGQWAKDVLVPQLYGNLACRVAEGNETPASIEECDSGSNYMQLVQLLSNWNVGFLNTTFVRASFQPGCYIEQPEPKWEGGGKYIRSKTMAKDCANENCFTAAVAEEGQCYTSGGRTFIPDSYNLESFVGFNESGSIYFYNYSEASVDLGPYEMLGGYAISLGTTPNSASATLEEMIKKQYFTKNVAAVTFDWFTYNGNLDMFTHNVVSFSLLETGKLQKDTKSTSYSLHIYSGGGPYSNTRLAIQYLFIAYAVMVVYFVGLQCYELMQAFSDNRKKSAPSYMFFVNYYSNMWNRTDSVSLVITLISIMIYMQYSLNVFLSGYLFQIEASEKYATPTAAVDQYKMSVSGSAQREVQDDWYVMSQMEGLASTWSLYLNLGALNAFFIAVKVVKYANTINAFRRYGGTLAEGATRMAIFASVIGILLIGWSLFFHILFGIYDNTLATPLSSTATCFLWILGDFDLTPALEGREAAAIVGFLLFEIMMTFVMLNMFLATMINTYAATVGKLEILSEKERLEKSRQNEYIDVVYSAKEDFRGDIFIEKDPATGKVFVKKVKEGGQAHRAGVYGGGRGEGQGLGQGAEVVKINGEKDKWHRDYELAEEIVEYGIHAKNHDLVVSFKAPPIKEAKHWYSKFLPSALAGGFAGGGDDNLNLNLSVRHFWRPLGAVTYLSKELEKKEAQNKDDAQDDESGSDEEGKGEKKSDGEKILRTKTKKELDKLLFQRPVGGEAGEGDDEKEEGDNTKTILFMDQSDVSDSIKALKISGWEVWLDCLVTAIEGECEDDSIITEVLRTGDMTDTKDLRSDKYPFLKEAFANFYKLSADILEILKCKAKRQWYQALVDESQSKENIFRDQNDILHEYACELEVYFSQIMGEIQQFKGKKDTMIVKLSGLLDKQTYKQYQDPAQSGATEDRRPPHLARLSIPWPNAMGDGPQENLKKGQVMKV